MNVKPTTIADLDRKIEETERALFEEFERHADECEICVGEHARHSNYEIAHLKDVLGALHAIRDSMIAYPEGVGYQ